LLSLPLQATPQAHQKQFSGFDFASRSQDGFVVASAGAADFGILSSVSPPLFCR